MGDMNKDEINNLISNYLLLDKLINDLIEKHPNLDNIDSFNYYFGDEKIYINSYFWGTNEEYEIPLSYLWDENWLEKENEIKKIKDEEKLLKQNLIKSKLEKEELATYLKLKQKYESIENG